MRDRASERDTLNERRREKHNLIERERETDRMRELRVRE